MMVVDATTLLRMSSEMGFNDGGAVLTWEDIIKSFSYHGVYLKSWRILQQTYNSKLGRGHFLLDCTEVMAQSI